MEFYKWGARSEQPQKNGGGSVADLVGISKVVSGWAGTLAGLVTVIEAISRLAGNFGGISWGHRSCFAPNVQFRQFSYGHPIYFASNGQFRQFSYVHRSYFAPNVQFRQFSYGHPIYFTPNVQFRQFSYSHPIYFASNGQFRQISFGYCNLRGMGRAFWRVAVRSAGHSVIAPSDGAPAPPAAFTARLISALPPRGAPQRGSRTVKRVPWPGSLCASTVPPCSSTILRTMDKPRPLPEPERVRPLSAL